MKLNYHTTETTFPNVQEQSLEEKVYFYSSSPSPLFLPSSSSYSFISDVGILSRNENTEATDFTRVTGYFNYEEASVNHTTIPLFFDTSTTIKIPSKVEYSLRRHSSRKLLKEIHADIDVAIELCLLFLTQLNSTVFRLLEDSSFDGWKPLKAEYSRRLLSLCPLAYKKVVDVLEAPLLKGAILECDNIYTIGEKSFYYRLGEAYVKKGLVNYVVKSKEVNTLITKNHFRKYNVSLENAICRNLQRFYKSITLPAISKIEERGKKLVDMKYKCKNGNRLVHKNKHSRGYHKKAVSFVEDDIALYLSLTENGLRIPMPGSYKSGGRVVDSFTLMPSWIRQMILIDGEPYCEVDYSCLHPNIAMSLYGGSKEYLTHTSVSELAGIKVEKVKVEHLSFFNKHVSDMIKSPLFEFYTTSEPALMTRLIDEKYNTSRQYRFTSQRLFTKEVEIMTDVIIKLNREGIFVGYVYDALFCVRKNAQRIKEVMDEVILKHSVKTKAKIEDDKTCSKKSAVEATVTQEMYKRMEATPESFPVLMWLPRNAYETAWIKKA